MCARERKGVRRNGASTLGVPTLTTPAPAPEIAFKHTGGIPAYGTQRSEWDAGCHPGAANPEHR
jgi:hypothetical protein